MSHGHLSDDQLIEICLSGSGSPADQHHLSACGECDVRRAEYISLLAEVSDAAIDEADAAFPDERLARQHARILHRIEQDGRPGRVIAFPAGRSSEPVSLRTRPGTRMIAAAP